MIRYLISLLALSTFVPSALGQGAKQNGGQILNIEDYGVIADTDPTNNGYGLEQGTILSIIGQYLEDLANNETLTTIVIDAVLKVICAIKPNQTSQELDLILNNTMNLNATLALAQPGDTVLIPDGKTFSLFGGAVLDGKKDVTIDFAGRLNFVYNTKEWPAAVTWMSTLRGYTLSDNYANGIMFYNCTDITITSSTTSPAVLDVDYVNNDITLEDPDAYHGGMLVGNGQLWWRDAIFQCFKFDKNPDLSDDPRPRLFYVAESSGILMENLTLVNSPYWTVNIEAVDSEVRYVNVYTDDEYQVSTQNQRKQLEDIRKNKSDSSLLPGNEVDELFPEFVDFQKQLKQELDSDSDSDSSIVQDLLSIINRILDALHNPQDLNTDGIDPAGANIWIHDCIIKNSDDSVAVKSSRNQRPSWSVIPDCTQNITVTDTVMSGFGAAIGSLNPNIYSPCIDGVRMERINMPGTGKGIYVKPNGNACDDPEVTGSISNIYFKDVTITKPLWWGIWIGPQQQHQPGTSLGYKCALTWPISGQCPAPSCVSVENVALEDVSIVDPVWPWTGAIMGNSTNPMTGVTLVNTATSPIRNGLLDILAGQPRQTYAGCENAEGSYFNATPAPDCLVEVDEFGELVGEVDCESSKGGKKGKKGKKGKRLLRGKGKKDTCD